MRESQFKLTPKVKVVCTQQAMKLSGKRDRILTALWKAKSTEGATLVKTRRISQVQDRVERHGTSCLFSILFFISVYKE